MEDETRRNLEFVDPCYPGWDYDYPKCKYGLNCQVNKNGGGNLFCISRLAYQVAENLINGHTISEENSNLIHTLFEYEDCFLITSEEEFQVKSLESFDLDKDIVNPVMEKAKKFLKEAGSLKEIKST